MTKINQIVMVLMTILTAIIPMLKKATSVKGIKELKEALIAALEIGLLVFSKFRDGVQFKDFTEMYSALIEDGEFKAKVHAGYDKYKEIPAEIEDIDTGEVLELVQVGVQYTPKFIEVAKEEPKKVA